MVAPPKRFGPLDHWVDPYDTSTDEEERQRRNKDQELKNVERTRVREEATASRKRELARVREEARILEEARAFKAREDAKARDKSRASEEARAFKAREDAKAEEQFWTADVMPSEPLIEPLATQIAKYQKDVEKLVNNWRVHLILCEEVSGSPTDFRLAVSIVQEDQREFLALGVPELLKAFRDEMNVGMNGHILSFIYEMAEDYTNAKIQKNIGLEHFRAGHMGIMNCQVTPKQR